MIHFSTTQAGYGLVNDSSVGEPPSSLPHTPSVGTLAALGGPEHLRLSKLLEARGSVEGLIDESTGVDVKLLGLAGVFHDEPSNILDYILSESFDGRFRRRSLFEHDQGEGIHRLVYWQHYESGKKFVEFLLDIQVTKTDKTDTTTYLIELNSVVNEEDLPTEAKEKLEAILNPGKVNRGILRGKMLVR